MSMRTEKEIVRSFYDTFGWKKNEGGFYGDTAAFADNRPVMNTYAIRANRRVGRFLNSKGRYLLDAASGAITFPEYIDYSAQYQKRICLDFSLTALCEARDKLGNKGFYILADINRLPFRREIFDAIVSLHTIYHVLADEQESAVRELFDTLKPGGKLIIVTVLHHSRLTEVMLFVRNVLWRFIKVIPFVNKIRNYIKNEKLAKDGPLSSSVVNIPPLYYFPREIAWWKAVLKNYLNSEIRIWRTVDKPLSENCIPNNWLGRLILGMIYVFETIAPHLMVYIGRYPMIIITKSCRDPCS